jgi:hypothetical protein
MITWLLAELIQLGGRLIGPGQLAVSPRDLLAVTAIALVGLAVALREKSWSAAFQRQRDPDAAGRPRPRAPGTAPAAA